MNASLEQRVKSRTADLIAARDKAEVLLAEVNHRVANSLSMVAALVRLQSNGIKDQVAKDALNETQGRIDAIIGGAQVAVQFGRRAVRRSRTSIFRDFSAMSKRRCVTRAMAPRCDTTWSR